ncbi:DoxX family protein [Seonamhaeicola sp. NFXS20]|uniref:DoxX family protein n=1 Tax=Seonamhaeicola sp. NFXS20 TaxID=2816959 RepID=UPI003B8BC6F0
MKKNADLGLLILRITVAGLMLFHGFAKLGHIDGIKNMLSSNGLPELMAYGVYITEIIAPIFIIIGYRTRLASLAFFLGMLFIIFLAHANDIFSISDKGALKNELIYFYTFGSVALFFTGGGKYAISLKNIWD